MAAYSLLASQSTVQVLSPTVVNDVVYCTIQTIPSSAIVSMPVSKVAFDNNGAAEELTALADSVEQLLANTAAIAASGTQTIDASGLLQDQVVFTVQYVPPGATTSNVTADATVGVGMLSQSDPAFAGATIAEAEAIITGVYDNLQSAAGG